MITSATIQDHEVLSEITKAAKAHWGYSAAQMKIWDSELTITADYIKKNSVWKLMENKTTIGYYSLEKLPDQITKLENLFVRPSYMGKGYGKELLRHALAQAKEIKSAKIILDSDPHATLFYEKYGFKIIGKKASSIHGRYLPIMEKTI